MNLERAVQLMRERSFTDWSIGTDVNYVKVQISNTYILLQVGRPIVSKMPCPMTGHF